MHSSSPRSPTLGFSAGFSIAAAFARTSGCCQVSDVDGPAGAAAGSSDATGCRCSIRDTAALPKPEKSPNSGEAGADGIGATCGAGTLTGSLLVWPGSVTRRFSHDQQRLAD